jgi:hypothetical protein
MITIGAHFAAVDSRCEHPLPGDYGYESARSGLFALLQAGKPKRVHIPNYICSAIPETLQQAGVEIARYPITDNFVPADPLEIYSDEWVLLVDYFGLCADSVERQLAALPRSQVIVDCSQAFFQPAFDCLATIYSARKFLPVADGGFVATRMSFSQLPADESAAMQRYRYLQDRALGEPEASRAAYLAAETQLEQASLRAISKFTRQRAAACDHIAIRQARISNFNTLAGLLPGPVFGMKPLDQVPLCYPLPVPDADKFRARLIERQIFTPKYWTDIIPMTNFERQLLQNTVFLPIDHRYNTGHMAYMADVVTDILNRSTR